MVWELRGALCGSAKAGHEKSVLLCVTVVVRTGRSADSECCHTIVRKTKGALSGKACARRTRPAERAGGPVRESDVVVGATFPAKKGQVYFGRFYLGKRHSSR